MLSRIAENLYWMGRYVERAENTARLLDVNYHALMEAPLVTEGRGIVTEQWAPLLNIMDDEATFRRFHDRADASSVPTWMTVSNDNPSSIRSSLSQARENARALRNLISTEMWEMLNRTYLELCTNAVEFLEEDTLHDYCVNTRDASHLFFGIADATLPRDLGWHFIRAGQYLERSDNTIRTLMVRYRQYQGQAPVAEGIELHRGMALLKSLSAYEAFRRVYHKGLAPEPIAEFLLLNPDFPRSVRYSIRVVSDILNEIAERNPGTSAEPSRQAGWLAARLEYLKDATPITEKGEPSLEDLLVALANISDALNEAYFAQASSQAQFQSQSQTSSSGSQSQSQSQSGGGSQSQSQSQKS